MCLYTRLLVTAQCADTVGYVLYINVVLLVGRGWTITTDKARIIYIYIYIFSLLTGGAR